VNAGTPPTPARPDQSRRGHVDAQDRLRLVQLELDVRDGERDGRDADEAAGDAAGLDAEVRAEVRGSHGRNPELGRGGGEADRVGAVADDVACTVDAARQGAADADEQRGAGDRHGEEIRVRQRHAARRRREYALPEVEGALADDEAVEVERCRRLHVQQGLRRHVRAERRHAERLRGGIGAECVPVELRGREA